ncbi:MAG TPA: sigma 54-interacting transcriptional regulator [Thermoanaerobaculia bacterium]|nr:sigma 54-interacting transcriptional regulator [Thermoanaerobaculia bacterium]
MPNSKEEPADRLLQETRTHSGSGLPAVSLLVPGLTVLCHPDLRRVGERAALTRLAAGQPELLARHQPLFAAPGQALRRPLGDVHLSRRPLELARAAAPGAVLLRCAGTRTEVVADGEPVTGERELAAAEIARGVVLLLANRIVLLLSLVEATTESLPRHGLVGESPPMARLQREIRRVADLDLTILLTGETGTGKELVARALHRLGRRRERPFVAVNMGAVPATLAAAELFGAARGAYTGADRARPGYFSRADGGTLFLDEIGEAPLEIQVMLLRVLESREVTPVGGGEVHAIDVQLIAATDAALAAAAAQGRFKAPLLYRLSGYEIRLPALRERREDFGRLFFSFLAAELAAIGAAARLEPAPEGARPWMSAALVARLAQADWPGNVRQLRNVARQLAVGCHDAAEAALPPDSAIRLGPAAAGGPEALSQGPAAPAALVPAAPDASGGGTRSRRPAYRRLEDVGDDEILAALSANRWRLKPAAAQLGVARASLYDRIDSGSRFRKAADLTREEIDRCAARCGGDLERMAAALEVSKPGLKRRLSRLD